MESKSTTVDNFSNLPIDIIFNILTRLPLKTLSTSRFVSKSWYSFILNPNFTQLHFTLNPHPCAIFLTRYTTSHLIDPISLSNHQTSAIAYPLNLKNFRKNFTISNGWNCFEIVGTVNGLVCFSPEGCDYEPAPYYIVNPITRDYVLLPKSPKIRVKPVGSGFGFDSIKNEYKLIRILPKSSEVYTMGSGIWRKIQLTTTDVPSLTVTSMRQSTVLVNGCLHWKIESDYHTLILSFAMAREEFGLIRMPPIREESDMFRFFSVSLVVLNDCLCVVDNYYKGGTTDMWSMKKYGVHDSWVKEYVIQPNVIRTLWNGGHEALELKNNELLLVGGRKDLIYYDIKNKVSKRISLLDLEGDRAYVEPDFVVCLEGSLISPTTIESNSGEVSCRTERAALDDTCADLDSDDEWDDVSEDEDERKEILASD